MKIDVYTIEYESFRYGDSQGIEVFYFFNESDRDKYFNYIVEEHISCGVNEYFGDVEENERCLDDGDGKWYYNYRKSKDVISIVEKIENNKLAY